jgi:aryl-alcohol dehydrogenase-like predicted oxidoreductase
MKRSLPHILGFSSSLPPSRNLFTKMTLNETTIPTRSFGKTKEQIGCIGFGAMGLAAFYGESADQETVDELLNECLNEGVNMIDTADMYSPWESGKMGYNEEQIGRFLKKYPEQRNKIFLATKFVNFFTSTGMEQRGDREYAFKACNDSLKRLGVEQIDLYYAHRSVPGTDVTITVGAMKELQEQGKIKYIGVSEYNLDQLERANKVVHIDAVQIEISPWTPDILTNGILDWCEKNGTAVVAYSPLGRGFLTGKYKSPDDFSKDDFRASHPRFIGENFDKNLELVRDIKNIADKKGATPGQITLAWCLSKSPLIIPIPGTKKLKYLKENIDAANIQLSSEDIEEIDKVINSFKVSGERYANPQSLAF